VIIRGSARAEVFHKREDYAAFIRLIRDAHARLPMRLTG
jgi:putative transposase